MPEHVTVSELNADPHAVAFDDPRTVCLRLDAGGEVAPHTHPDHDVLILVLDGALSVRLDGEEHSLDEGEALRFDGEREVAPRAETGATALVVLCERRET